MITFQQFTNWHVRAITTYRFLEKEYIDDFLQNGKIRLSSFSKFRQHQDEIRGDNREGGGIYMTNYKPEVGNGHNFFEYLTTGKNAFIICTSLINKMDSFNDCNYDSGFIIKDVCSFALEISRAIPFFIGGMQGQCFYVDPPIIRINLGEFNIDTLSPIGFITK